MRIGVNTGEVVVGTVAGTDLTVMGDVVNTAARLQQLAPPGTVLVGDATKALCSPTLRFRTYDEVQLRGREQPVYVWQAVAHDAAAVARRWQSDLPFVGRTTELGVLRNLSRIALAGRSAVIAVTGEPGIGKSRLLHELVSELVDVHPGSLVLEGACAPYGESNVWWPLASGLFARLGLSRDDGVEDARRRVTRKLGAFDELEPGTPQFERLVEVVLHLLGHPSALDALGPAATRDAVIGAIVERLRRRAEQAPVVIWIDDVQWAAPMLLDAIEALARRLADVSVLVLTTYRRSDDGLTDWPASIDPALTLHLPLAPLDDDAAVDLVQIAAGRSLNSDVVRSISSRAGGNPLFLTELARLAAAAPTGAELPELPGTLRALIASRLDRLTASQRSILDNAAILGVEGRLVALRAFAAELGQSFDLGDLDLLDAEGLLIRDGGRWQFRSDVVREVAYSTLTKQARAQRHAGVARYLAHHGESVLDQRAHHLASAAELVREIGPTPGVASTIDTLAAEALLADSRRAFQQGAHRRSIQLVERALGLDPDGELRRQALLLLAEGLVETRALGRGRDVLADVLALCAESGDRVARAEAMRLRGTIAQMEGDLVGARRDLGEAVSELRLLGDRGHLGEALRARGFAEVFGGSLRDAEWFLGEADAVYEEVGDERGRAWVQQHLAWVSFLGGDHATSEQRLTGAIAAFERLGDRAGVTWAQGLLAYVHHFALRSADAEQLAALVYDEARRWGDEWGASMMLNLQASIRLWAGDVDTARQLSERALAGFRRIDDRFGTIQTLATYNRALVASGRSADAERSVEEILVLADSFGQMSFPAMAAAGASMHAGNGRRAAELATDAVRHLDTTGVNIDEGRVVLAFGRLLAGDPEQALIELEPVDVEHSPFALACRATARAMLGDVEGVRSDVRRVAEIDGADGHISYWDRWIARVAGVAVDPDGASSPAAVAMADEIGSLTDVVVRSYARDVLDRLAGNPAGDHPSARAPREWADVARAVVERGQGDIRRPRSQADECLPQ
jgi:tetratricopeptide (TPR) repeat protein